MRKKVLCIALALLMCMMVTLPTLADGSAETPLNKAYIAASYGVKSVSGSTYKMWAKLNNPEGVTVVVVLSLYDASYNYITSISKTSSSTIISLSKDVSLSSGTYHLRLSYTAGGATYTSEKTYNI